MPITEERPSPTNESMMDKSKLTEQQTSSAASEGPPYESMPEHMRLNHEQAASGKIASDSSWFNRLLVMMMPLAPKAMVWPVAKRYVAGDTSEQMIHKVKELNASGCSAIVNILGEFIKHPNQARENADSYKAVLHQIAEHQLDSCISIKPTSLGLLLDKQLCRQLYGEVLETARNLNNFVRVEMEDSPTTTDIVDLYLDLRKTYDNAGIVLQAYLRRTHDDVLRVCQADAGNVRLCKGIYVEPRWLAYKLPDLVNQNYLACLEEMFSRGAYVGIATHDERLVWGALKLIRRYNLTPEQYEFQMLMGVDHELREMLVTAGHKVKVYVPYGPDWHAYSIRRFKENPKIAGYVLKNLFHS